jgi:hypothetical protein
MWISGRRAFRPDSNYYRTVRKKNPSAAARLRRASGLTVIVAAVVALVAVGIWWMIHH